MKTVPRLCFQGAAIYPVAWMALTYFINRKRTTCVITFKGVLALSAPDFFDDCLKEATAQATKYFVLNMGGIKEVDPSVSRAFTLFQQGLRNQGKLFLCDIPLHVNAVLASEGVLRKPEICADLLSSLQMILNCERGLGEK